jgi:hypothetical protein
VILSVIVVVVVMMVTANTSTIMITIRSKIRKKPVTGSQRTER